MEARKEPRFVVQYPISFEGMHGAGEGKLFNICVGGCAIESLTPAQVNADITLRLHISSQEGRPLQVKQARVTWSGGRHFGVQFLHIDPQEQNRLHQLIAGLIRESLRKAS